LLRRGMYVNPDNVVPAEDQWGVRREGSERLTSIHPTQGEAIEAGREIARNQQTEPVIHKPNVRSVTPIVTAMI
jgi:hypothetical protein